jgi:hypothetical protein
MDTLNSRHSVERTGGGVFSKPFGRRPVDGDFIAG